MNTSIYWDLSSLAHVSRGLYCKVRIDDTQRRYTYVKWFRGRGMKIVSFKDAVFLFNSKIHTSIKDIDKLVAECIMQRYVLKKYNE